MRIGQNGSPQPIAHGRNVAHPDALTADANASLPGSHGTIVAVVPDRVARLEWIWPREFNSGALSYDPAISMSAAVTDNLAIATAPARFTWANRSRRKQSCITPPTAASSPATGTRATAPAST